ncbi:hypothetical protein TNCV_305671 [Trichonephila clavipes]|nr:hypothetical protein TNCV_305671 [Trichonephila clavipes]
MIHLKRQLGANQFTKIWAHDPITNAAVDGLPTPVAVDQRAAWRQLYGHSPHCGAGIDHRTLMSPSVIHCQFFKLFGALRSIASCLASLWNCSAAHEPLLRNRKILLFEG